VANTPGLVTVIVPVYNGRIFVQRLLESVVKNTPVGSYELVVVDDASDQEDMEGLYAHFEHLAQITILRNTHNLGFGKSTNRGFAIGRGEYFYLVNSDALVQRGWLEQAVAMLRSPPPFFGPHPLGAVQSRILLPVEKHPGVVIQTCGSMFDALGRANYHLANVAVDDVRANTPCVVDSFMGCGVLISRVALEAAGGGFDESFGKYYLEDTDLSLRMSGAGYAVGYCPSSTIIHLHGTTTGVYVQDRAAFAANLQQSQLRFAQKWPPAAIGAALRRVGRGEQLGVGAA
jgi:GT2 family glycosyltransferase